MEDKRYEQIDKTFAAFGFGTLQSFKTLVFLMDREGISMDEFTLFMKLKAAALANNQPVGTLCPECKAPMRLEFVNINPGTMTEDNSKIVYTCSHCMHQIFK